jgi:hypothetical protein
LEKSNSVSMWKFRSVGTHSTVIQVKISEI